jgi:putative oxidoreductase
MKINYAFVSRSLIALLFVVAGVQKAMSFTGVTGFIGSLPPFAGIGSSALAMVVTVLVIIIEIPVALAFAWGYRICTTGMILAGFTVVATVLVHNNLQVDLVMILKNIAVIGGILAATILCGCGKCPMGKECAKCK